MALLADRSLDAGSNLVEGTGTNSITFTMPGNVVLSVESVVAHIDTTAAGATTATLTIRDSSGVVIAEVAQSDTVDAALSDAVATWALRLDANAQGGTSAGFIKYDFANVGDWLHVDASGTSGAGAIVFDAYTGDIRFFVDNTATGKLQINGGDFRVFTSNAEFTVRDDGQTFFTGVAASWQFSSDFALDANSFSFDIKTAGQNVTINDHSGNPIFRVDEDGSLHGKTGQTLTFDL